MRARAPKGSRSDPVRGPERPARAPGRGGVGLLRALALVAVALATSVVGLGAQTLADYDYENLGFRGVAFEGGYLIPSRVDNTYSFGLRLDLGYLGPGLRILPGISYWSSEFKRSEVAEFERKLDALIARQTDPGETPTTVELGGIDWSDLVLSLDGQVVWDGPLGMLPYVGAGASVHLLNGEGDAVSGTFVEDLLDAVRAGINLQAGLEFPFTDHFRLYGGGRYEVLGDLQYLEIRVGGQIMFASPAPGEGRSGRPTDGGDRDETRIRSQRGGR